MNRKQLVIFALSIPVLASAWFSYIYLTLPDVKSLGKCLQSEMHKVDLCSNSSTYSKLDRISPIAIEAFVLSEDAAFFQHQGFDWHELKTSFFTNLKRGHFARGGSTITQQLTKNVYTSGEKSLTRKLREAILARRIEQTYRKDLILEKYLNVIELGPELYGVKMASLYYFEKKPARLSLLESVYLAHLLPNPKVYSKGYQEGRLTEFSKNMMTVLLKRIHRFGRISDGQLQDALDNIDQFPWKRKSLIEEMYELMNDTSANDHVEVEEQPNEEAPIKESPTEEPEEDSLNE